MKKRFAALLAVILLAAVLLPAKAEAKAWIPDGLMLKIYNANRGAALREKYDSIWITEAGKSGSHAFYEDGGCRVTDRLEDGEYVRIVTERFDYALTADGSFARFIDLEPDASDPWGAPCAELLTEEPVRWEEKKGLGILTTHVPAPDGEGEGYQKQYTVDAKTFELESLIIRESVNGKAGDVLWEVDVYFNEPPRYDGEIRALEEHLAAASETRLTTLIFDPDTLLARVYAYETPAGDACLVQLRENGVDYEIDEARSTLSNAEGDNDVILYLIRTAIEADG